MYEQASEAYIRTIQLATGEEEIPLDSEAHARTSSEGQEHASAYVGQRCAETRG